MLVCAMIVPTKTVPVFRVAELPTCQKTLQASAPPVTSTRAPTSVISDDADWKIQTELASPVSVSVSSGSDPERARCPVVVVEARDKSPAPERCQR